MSTDAHPDSELLNLVPLAVEAHERLSAAHELDSHEAVNQAARAAGEVRRRMIETPARTLDGALAKARAALIAYIPDDLYEEVQAELEASGPTLEVLLLSLLRDLGNLDRPACAIDSVRLTATEWPVVLESYATWLRVELESLAADYPHLRGLVWLDSRAGRYHRGAPPPSARAVHMLDAVGVDWRADASRDRDGPG